MFSTIFSITDLSLEFKRITAKIILQKATNNAATNGCYLLILSSFCLQIVEKIQGKTFHIQFYNYDFDKHNIFILCPL